MQLTWLLQRVFPRKAVHPSRFETAVGPLLAEGRRLRDSLDALPTALAEVKEAMALLEERFLATGSALEELSRQGELFVCDSGKLVSIATGQVGGGKTFVQGMAVIERPLNFLGSCHQETELLLGRLQQDRQRIVQLLRAEADLQRTMAPLKFMQTLFKVESAPLGEEVQGMFTALTQEIEQLHSQVREIFSSKFQELEQIERTIGGVVDQLQEQSQVLWNRVAREKTQIETSTGRLTSELQANQSREARISLLSKKTSAEIQQIVVGLQFQDIVHQKLQHVTSALGQIQQRLNDAPESLDFLGPACRLEAQQLQAAREDLARAEKTIRLGIQNVLTHFTQADSECLSLEEFKLLTTSADGMVQVLLDVIESVRQQLAATEANAAGTLQALRPISGLASGLTLVVRDLSLRIHLIGLNAQIQAAQVAQGTGLEVLSARTSEISRETSRISQEVAKELDQLVSGLGTSMATFQQLHQQAQAEQQELDLAGREEERRLHRLRDEALAALTTVSDLFGSIRTLARDALQTINYVETTDGALAALQDSLQAIADAAGRSAETAADQPLVVEAGFRRDYTMASEREVHDRVLGKSSPEDPTTDPTSARNGWEGVELFAEPESAEPGATSATASAEAVNPAGGEGAASAVPPDSSGLAPTAPAAGSGGAGDLGANVELF